MVSYCGSRPLASYGFLPWLALLLLSPCVAWFFLPAVAPNKTICIRVQTNGVPQLLGIPLRNSTIRCGVLRVLRQANARVAFVAPYGGMARTNADALRDEMVEAGINGSIRGGIR